MTIFDWEWGPRCPVHVLLMFSLIYRDEQVQELENQLTSAKEHIEQLANERTVLIAKVC